MTRSSQVALLLLAGAGLMFVSHFVVLFVFMLSDLTGVALPPYAIAYPVVYGMGAAAIARRAALPGWLLGLALCAAPILYWGWDTLLGLGRHPGWPVAGRQSVRRVEHATCHAADGGGGGGCGVLGAGRRAGLGLKPVRPIASLPSLVERAGYINLCGQEKQHAEDSYQPGDGREESHSPGFAPLRAIEMDRVRM